MEKLNFAELRKDNEQERLNSERELVRKDSKQKRENSEQERLVVGEQQRLDIGCAVSW
jgi:hypothetical protein